MNETEKRRKELLEQTRNTAILILIRQCTRDIVPHIQVSMEVKKMSLKQQELDFGFFLRLYCLLFLLPWIKVEKRLLQWTVSGL